MAAADHNKHMNTVVTGTIGSVCTLASGNRVDLVLFGAGKEGQDLAIDVSFVCVEAYPDKGFSQIRTRETDKNSTYLEESRGGRTWHSSRLFLVLMVGSVSRRRRSGTSSSRISSTQRMSRSVIGVTRGRRCHSHRRGYKGHRLRSARRLRLPPCVALLFALASGSWGCVKVGRVNMRAGRRGGQLLGLSSRWGVAWCESCAYLGW